MSVARDRFSGALLGPSNHHGYQAALRKLYEERYSRRIEWQAFLRNIENVSDPAAIEVLADIEDRRRPAGDALKDWGLAHRFAGWIDVDTRRVDEWIERVHRYGFRAVLIGRLIPGLRVAMSLIAGPATVPMWRFSAGVFVAATIYWTGWVLLGALVGPRVDDLIAPYVGYIAIGIPVFFITLFVLRVIQVRRRTGRQPPSIRDPGSPP